MCTKRADLGKVAVVALASKRCWVPLGPACSPPNNLASTQEPFPQTRKKTIGRKAPLN